MSKIFKKIFFINFSFRFSLFLFLWRILGISLMARWQDKTKQHKKLKNVWMKFILKSGKVSNWGCGCEVESVWCYCDTRIWWQHPNCLNSVLFYALATKLHKLEFHGNSLKHLSELSSFIDVYFRTQKNFLRTRKIKICAKISFDLLPMTSELINYVFRTLIMTNSWNEWLLFNLV